MHWFNCGRLRRPLALTVVVCALGLSVMAAPVAAVAPAGAVAGGRASETVTTSADAVKTSQRVRELIRLVERSDLRCEVRNELVEQLRLLDDALRSGNLTAVRALITAWRGWAQRRAGTGLLNASTNDVIQQRLAQLEGQFGLEWPRKPKPVRQWPKLPACGVPSAGTAGSGDSSASTWDSGKTLTSLTTALYMIPSPIGSLFAGLVFLMWPTDDPVDVTEIVDQEILEYALAQGGADLAAIQAENSEYWQPALKTWLTECGWTEKSPPEWQPAPGCGSVDARSRVVYRWDNMLADLIRTASAMQLNSGGVDYRAELLPMYVQVENLLIAHLQLGVVNRQNWWPTSELTQQNVVDELRMHTETEPGDPPEVGQPIDPKLPDVTGVGYVEKVFTDNTTSNDPTVTDYPVKTDSAGRLNIADWKARNAWARDHGTIEALYFSDLWPSMDPIAFPNGNPSFRQTRIIYTDPIGYENPFWHYYRDLDPSDTVSPLAPGNVSGPLARLEVWQDNSVDYLKKRAVIDAVRVTPQDGVASPIMGDPNPTATPFAWQVGLSTTDPTLAPIVKVHVAEGYESYKDADANVHWPQGFQFTFLGGVVGTVGSFSTTGIDGKPLTDTKLHLYDYSYDGQILATVKVLDTHQWKDIWGNVKDTSADTVVFGFRFADSLSNN